MRMLFFCTAILVLAGIALDQARGQGSATVPNNAVQGFAQNRDQPVRIEAPVLEMRDRKKEATFSGGVKVVQGDTTMTSKTLVAFYEGTSAQPSAPARGVKGARGTPMPSATPGPGGASSIKWLEAKGNVVVIQKDQVVTGETAIFDTRTNLITMRGGVVLTQCQNVVRGDRLLVDMTTGVSRVESDTGKVQVLVVQGQSCGGVPAGPAPVSLPSASAKPAKSR